MRIATYSGLVRVIKSGRDCAELIFVALHVYPATTLYPPPWCTYALCPCRQKLLPSSSSSSELLGPSLLEREAAAPRGVGAGGRDGRYVGMKSLTITTVRWNSRSAWCSHMIAIMSVTCVPQSCVKAGHSLLTH